MSAPKIAAWTVFILDATLVMAVVLIGIGASGRMERATMLALAAVGAVPLAGLFAIVFFSSRRGSRFELSISLALGVVPLVL